jgi:hypothetical protein
LPLDRTVWCCRDELRRRIGHCRHFPRPSSTGAHRSRFEAPEDRYRSVHHLKKPFRPINIGSNLSPLLPRSVVLSTSSQSFAQFLWRVIVCRSASLVRPLQSTSPSPCSPYPADSSLGVCPPIAPGSFFHIQHLIATTSPFGARLAPSRWNELRSMSSGLPGYPCHGPPPLPRSSIVHGDPPKPVRGSRESRRQWRTRERGESALWSSQL